MMRTFFTAAVAGAGLLLTVAGTQAAPLNLMQQPPDIGVSQVQVSYTAGTGTLTAVGDAVTIDFDGAGLTQFVTGSPDNFSLTASIDNTGNFSGGSFTITGSTSGAAGSFGPGTLLAGTLTAFGAGGSGTPFEFLFTPTGGDLADSAGDPLVSSFGGIILGSIGWTGDFTSDFTVENQVGDVFVPLPGAVWLFGSALVALTSVTRRRPQA